MSRIQSELPLDVRHCFTLRFYVHLDALSELLDKKKEIVSFEICL
jgi:hypothetical protein